MSLLFPKVKERFWFKIFLHMCSQVYDVPRGIVR